VYDIIRGLILVGENGCGDEFGIGCDESFTILQIAQMFGGEIDMLPERRGNRMVADVVTDKTRALGWETTKSVKNYIKEFKSTL